MNKEILMPTYDHSILSTITSILKYYGVSTKYKSNNLIDEKLNKKYKNVVLLILDGMGKYILDDIDKDGYFSRNTIDNVTSVYPSTTTAALTTYYAGRPPYETGYIAWSQYFKEYGRQLDMFARKDSYNGESYSKKFDVFENIMNYETIFEKIEKCGTKAYEIVPGYSTKRSKRTISADNIDELIEGLNDLTRIDEEKFIMAYCDHPDSILHKYGTKSDIVKSFILETEDKIQNLSNNLEDTIIIISADHGHKDIEKVYSIMDYLDLYECLFMPESLESRCVSFLVKDDKKEYFKNRFNELFGKEFVLYTKEEFLDNNLLGYGDKSKKLDDFLGNFIAVSISSSIFQIKNYYFDGKSLKKSTHCGLTKEEMLVPVIVIESK